MILEYTSKQLQKMQQVLHRSTLVLGLDDLNCNYTDMDIHKVELYHVRNSSKDIEQAYSVIIRIGGQQKVMKEWRVVGGVRDYCPEITRTELHEILLQVKEDVRG